MEKDKNLELLESLNYGVSYLHLPKVDGRVTYNFDTSRDVYVHRTSTYWLRWKNEFYISLPCVGAAEQIKEIQGSMVSDRNSDLYKCLNPQIQVQMIAQIEETKEEGIFVLGNKKIRDKVIEMKRDNVLKSMALEITTSVSKDKNGKEVYSRTPLKQPKKYEYKSDIEFSAQLEPSQEAIDYYVDLVKRLAYGENVDVEVVREEFNKFFKDSKGNESHSLEEIFGGKGPQASYEESNSSDDLEFDDNTLEFETIEERTLEQVRLEFDDLAKKANLRLTDKIKANLDNKEWLESTIEKLKQRVGA